MPSSIRFLAELISGTLIIVLELGNTKPVMVSSSERKHVLAS
jgi:hypothetical protein